MKPCFIRGELGHEIEQSHAITPVRASSVAFRRNIEANLRKKIEKNLYICAVLMPSRDWKCLVLMNDDEAFCCTSSKFYNNSDAFATPPQQIPLPLLFAVIWVIALLTVKFSSIQRFTFGRGASTRQNGRKVCRFAEESSSHWRK